MSRFDLPPGSVARGQLIRLVHDYRVASVNDSKRKADVSTAGVAFARRLLGRCRNTNRGRSLIVESTAAWCVISSGVSCARRGG